MQFGLDEEQDALAEMVRDLLRDSYPSGVLSTDAVVAGEYDRELWRVISAEMELAGLAIPEDLGGSGGGVAELCVVLTELGRSLYNGPYLSTAVLAVAALLTASDDEVVREVLQEIASGSTTATVVGIDHGERTPRLTATVSDSGWTIDGIDTLVIDGSTAEHFIVMAEVNGSLGAFVVDASDAGIARERRDGIDITRPLSTVQLTAAAARPFGGASAGQAVLDRLAVIAPVAIAAEQAGAARFCVDLTVEHVKQRTQFGRPIGSFQAVKHRCAEMELAVSAAEATALYSAWSVDTGAEDAAVASSIAKSGCCEAGYQAAKGTIQLLGGMGYTWEHPAQHYLRRATASRQLFGSPSDHGERLASLVLGDR